jgi:uncharacterized membrane-anchored protein YjiN (DUF445 family)
MVAIPAVDEARQRRYHERRQSLRRMRLVATGLLVLMLVAFAICWKFEAVMPWLAYPRAFAEAGMVGACADWFAVVALFRHPLGVPIPHTAILPRNKQRIGDMLGNFFTGNFFNQAEIAARLETVDAAGWLCRWLNDGRNVRQLAQWSRELVLPALDLVGHTQFRSASGDLIRNGIDSIAAAPLAGRVLAVLVAQGQDEAAFDLGLEAVIDFIGKNRDTIRQKAGEKTAGWMPKWVDARLADAFLDGLLETLATARDPDHPWREEFRDFLDRLTRRLADDPVLEERLERIKADVLDTKLVDDYLAWFTAEIETRLKTGLQVENGTLLGGLEHSLTTIGGWIETNENAREAINRSLRQLVMNTLAPHRDEIGAYVSDIVARWDNETLVERLELQVGRDLQFIRINGTLVGGTVGLILFAIAKLLG